MKIYIYGYVEIDKLIISDKWWDAHTERLQIWVSRLTHLKVRMLD